MGIKFILIVATARIYIYIDDRYLSRLFRVPVFWNIQSMNSNSFEIFDRHEIYVYKYILCINV